jgi:hypothetical protein
MTKDDFVGGSMIIFCLLLTGALFTMDGKSALKREAIERNFAEYNSTNGVWQWKTNN